MDPERPDDEGAAHPQLVGVEGDRRGEGAFLLGEPGRGEEGGGALKEGLGEAHEEEAGVEGVGAVEAVGEGGEGEEGDGREAPGFDEGAEHVAEGAEEDGAAEAEAGEDEGFEGRAEGGGDEEGGDEGFWLDEVAWRRGGRWLVVAVVAVIGIIKVVRDVVLVRVVSARGQRGDGGDAETGPVGQEVEKGEVEQHQPSLRVDSIAVARIVVVEFVAGLGFLAVLFVTTFLRQ